MKICLIIAACGTIASTALAQPYRATPIPANQDPPVINPGNTDGPGFDMSWNTYDGGGGALAGGLYSLDGTVGQWDAGKMSGNGYEMGGGYWNMADEAVVCYANCDGSTGTPALTANDFQCFINAYAAGTAYANCDGSTGTPALTANDFQCFINKYAGGCS